MSVLPKCHCLLPALFCVNFMFKDAPNGNWIRTDERDVSRSMETRVIRRDDYACVHCGKKDCELFGCLILQNGPGFHLNGVTLCRECRANTARRAKMAQIDSDLRNSHRIRLRKRILKAEPTEDQVSDAVRESVQKWAVSC